MSVVALRLTGEVMTGSAEVSVIVWMPVPAMLNTMASKPARALASRIACRSVPAPELAVEVTVKVAPGAEVMAIELTGASTESDTTSSSSASASSSPRGSEPLTASMTPKSFSTAMPSLRSCCSLRPFAPFLKVTITRSRFWKSLPVRRDVSSRSMCARRRPAP